MRTIVIAVVVSLLVPLASGAAYLKIGAIKGEAADRAEAGEDIDVLAWSWGLSRTKGETTLGDVVVVRELDKSSTKLMSSASTGSDIELISLRVEASPDSFFDIYLENAQVSSYSISGQGDAVTEEVSFSYSQIRFEYVEQKADGTFDTEIVSMRA